MQLAALCAVVGEGQALGVGLEKEIERVVDRRLGNQIDFDTKFAHLFRKGESGNVIALRILLPVDEVRHRLHEQRIGKDRRTTVRSRTQTHEVRRETDRSIVAVVRDVIESDVNRHRPSMLAGLPAWRA